jgi:hypothetical protein
MGRIGDFERALERWISAAWALVRRPRSKPAEIVTVLYKECDENAMILGHGRTLVPNHFAIELPQDVHERLDAHSGELGPQLAALVRGYAAERRYTFAGPVTVRLEAPRSAEHPVTRYRVHSHVAPTAPAPAPGGHRDELTQLLPLPLYEPSRPSGPSEPAEPPEPAGSSKPSEPSKPPGPSEPGDKARIAGCDHTSRVPTGRYWA